VSNRIIKISPVSMDFEQMEPLVKFLGVPYISTGLILFSEDKHGTICIPDLFLQISYFEA
jgi:hypothetical protein